MELIDFLDCLFNYPEGICFSYTPRGTQVYMEEILSDAQFFSINPLHPTEDKRPTESYHASNKPRRADHNVTAYRNILIEMDKISLEDQVARIEEIGLPYSTCTYSGGKSFHYIISLAQDLPTRKDYDKLVRRIYAAVGNDIVDHANKNPSRFSRLPNAYRPDKDSYQELIAVNERIDNAALEAWLVSRGIDPIAETTWEDITYKSTIKKDFSALSAHTRNFLMYGAETGTWNHSLFKAAAELYRHGWNEQEVYERLSQITGTLDKVDERTIASAISNEKNTNAAI